MSTKLTEVFEQYHRIIILIIQIILESKKLDNGTAFILNLLMLPIIKKSAFRKIYLYILFKAQLQQYLKLRYFFFF